MAKLWALEPDIADDYVAGVLNIQEAVSLFNGRHPKGQFMSTRPGRFSASLAATPPPPQ
jgi:hypothetical protein